jgi:hypothetical protein
MLDEMLESFGMVATYRVIEKCCGYNDEAYRIMRQNLTNSNENGRPGMIFANSW